MPGAGDGHALLLAAGQLSGKLRTRSASPRRQHLVGVKRVAADLVASSTFSRAVRFCTKL